MHEGTKEVGVAGGRVWLPGADGGGAEGLAGERGEIPLPRLGMMVARAAGLSRSGLRPALRAPLTRLS